MRSIGRREALREGIKIHQNRKHNPTLTPFAKVLRKNMTKQERHLWYDFLRTYPVRVLRQKVIGLYVADFYCAKAKLVIELDGGQHCTEDGMRYDSEREKAMGGFGIKTIRYTNNEIDNQFNEVCCDIDKHIQNLMRLPSCSQASIQCPKSGNSQ